MWKLPNDAATSLYNRQTTRSYADTKSGSPTKVSSQVSAKVCLR